MNRSILYFLIIFFLAGFQQVNSQVGCVDPLSEPGKDHSSTMVLSYCAASGGCNEYINRVQAGTINNVTPCNNYSDFTATHSTNLPANGVVHVIVTNGNTQFGAYHCGIWVDWNCDSDFSDFGEQIPVTGTPGTGPFTAEIDPPGSQSPGACILRIRVASSGPLSPCGTTPFGEVEDYTLNITAPAANQWIGHINHDWSEPMNWSLELVPNPSVDVIINPGYTYHPIISGGAIPCKDITIGAGARISLDDANLIIHEDMNISGEVEVQTNGNFDVEGSVSWYSGSVANITVANFYVGGNWEYNPGTSINLLNSNVVFRGSSNQFIGIYSPGCSFVNIFNDKTAGVLTFAENSTDTLKINGNLNNQFSSSILNCSSSHPVLLKGDFTNNGHIYCLDGTFIYGGSSPEINLNPGDYFNNLIVRVTGVSVLLDSLRVQGDLTISSGTLNSNNRPVYLKGNWTNSMGSAAFVQGTGTVILNGSSGSVIQGAETFFNLIIDKTYAQYNGVTLTDDITVLNDLTISDGCIEMNSPADLFVGKNITIASGAGLNANDSYGAQISIGKNWNNQNAGYGTAFGFSPDNSTVIFNGTTVQTLSTNATREVFSNLRIDKPSGPLRSNDDLDVRGNVEILRGVWEDNIFGLTYRLSGNFTVAPEGSFNAGNFGNTLEFTGNTNVVLTNNSAPNSMHNLVINKSSGAMVTQVGDVQLVSSGNLIVQQGEYHLNESVLSVSGNVDVNATGTLSLGSSSSLFMNTNGNSININNGGRLEIEGTIDEPVTIGMAANPVWFNLNVNAGGTIAAEYGLFTNLGINGLNVVSGAVIDTLHAFTGCTFQNGKTGGTLLKINNNQDITIPYAVFPSNIYGTVSNVTKTSNAGMVRFAAFSGEFSGETFDNDPFNRIIWVPAMTATATATPATICPGLSSQLTVVVAGGSAPYTHAWSPGTGLSNPGVLNPVATPATTRLYSVTVTDALGGTSVSSVTVTVIPVNLTTVVTGIVPALATECYDAFQTITVGGGTPFTVQNGGSTTLVAGQNIRFLPGTNVLQGGLLYGYITQDYTFCGISKSAGFAGSDSLQVKTGSFSLFPNPTHDKFTLVYNGEVSDETVRVDILNMQGATVIKEQLVNHCPATFTIGNQPPGLYLVTVLRKDKRQTFNLILSK